MINLLSQITANYFLAKPRAIGIYVKMEVREHIFVPLGNGTLFLGVVFGLEHLLASGVIEKMPLTAQVAAVSVGIFEDEAVLDLNYAEDSHAIVDCNVVMTSKGEFIEVQGTGEGRPFTDTELRKLLGLGKRGCLTLCRKQAKVMGESL